MGEVTARFHAASAEDVEHIGGWVHDAYFDWRQIHHDSALRVVTVPFSQESHPDLNQAGPELVREGRFGARIYRVPFVRCYCRIAHATGVDVADSERDDPGMLNVVYFDVPTSAVYLDTTVGPEVRVSVEGIDVEITATSQVDFYVRRTATPNTHHDTRWADRDEQPSLSRRLLTWRHGRRPRL